MYLKDYFENTTGVGVLSTADESGHVDAAIYARPHCMEDGSIAFIMLDRLTHKNLETNPHAAYLFIEDGGGYKGVRLFLEKIREEKDSKLIQQLSRRCPVPEGEKAPGPRFLVFFRLKKILKLIGGETPDLSL
ncbi:MAG: pyridoxamine 5'-phosphate oxidase family protein [Syntrophotaleaceae bacterium]